MSDRTFILSGITLMLAWGLAYWSFQPTCGSGEVRVRGVFMTFCVAGL